MKKRCFTYKYQTTFPLSDNKTRILFFEKFSFSTLYQYAKTLVIRKRRVAKLYTVIKMIFIWDFGQMDIYMEHWWNSSQFLDSDLLLFLMLIKIGNYIKIIKTKKKDEIPISNVNFWHFLKIRIHYMLYVFLFLHYYLFSYISNWISETGDDDILYYWKDIIINQKIINRS